MSDIYEHCDAVRTHLKMSREVLPCCEHCHPNRDIDDDLQHQISVWVFGTEYIVCCAVAAAYHKALDSGKTDLVEQSPSSDLQVESPIKG